MTYEKPDVSLVGNAASVIQFVGKNDIVYDGGQTPLTTDPAYDLDE